MQFFVSPLPDGWVKEGCIFEADVISKNNGKTNHEGKHEFHGSLRDSQSLCLDVRTAIALQLFYVLVVENKAVQLLQDFKPFWDEDQQCVVRRWMDWYLIPGFPSTGPRKMDVFRSVSGASQRNQLKKTASSVGMTLVKGTATHMRRRRSHQVRRSLKMLLRSLPLGQDILRTS